MSDSNSGAGSSTKGLQNTTYMFNYDASAGMLAYQEWLLDNYPDEVASGGTTSTSTAAETPLAYMYTFGDATATADRDNAYCVRAIRMKPSN